LKTEQQDDGGLHGGGAFAMHFDEVGNRLEPRAVSNSLAQMAQDEAIEDSGWPAGDEGFEARDQLAMQAAAEKAADDVRSAMQAAAEKAADDARSAMQAAAKKAADDVMSAWGRRRQQQATELQSRAAVVKQEATEVQPAPPINRFGGLGDFRRYRVRDRNRAQNLTSNQMQGAIDAQDLTRTPPHRRRGAEAIFNAPLTKTEKDLNDL
jgi:hypothetical protein